MTIDRQLNVRSEAKCELCGVDGDLLAVAVSPHSGTDGSVLLCATCRDHLVSPATVDIHHWYCLREAMWNEHAAVKVLVYRILKGLEQTALGGELLGQMYLEPELQEWADAAGGSADAATGRETRDSNGVALQEGDAVTLIKDLDVKGASFTAKRGTLVRGIMLTDDPKYVEGKVNGIRIVLVAAYLKKA